MIMEAYVSIHTFGSTSEGTTTPGLNSDKDTMMCFRMFPVYENSEDAKHHMTQMRSAANLQEGKNPNHFVMLVDDHTPVGFSKLESVANNNLKFPFIVEQDTNGKTVLVNNYIVEVMTRDERNGPAATTLKRPGFTDLDFIPSFHCKTWPAVADEFFTRKRMFEFPGQNIRSEYGNLGIFFVPTGHGDSQERHLQWRLSFSLQERKIMLNLNETQHKCYVLLKMTKEDFVKPNVSGKSLTSYQCKTSMFFEMEISPDSFWIPENLIYCYINCLKRLRGWIQNGFVPSYFMPDVSIWKGDMTVRNKVVKVLEEVLESPLETLMRLRCDKVGSLLNDMSDYNSDRAGVPDNDFSTDLTQAERALQLTVHALHYRFIGETAEIARKLISENRGNVDANIKHHEKLIEMLNDKDSLCEQTLQSNIVVDQAVDYLVPFIYTSLGSHLIVKGILESSDIFKSQGLGYLQLGLESDFLAGKVKFAAVYFALRMYEEAAELLENHDGLKNDIITQGMCVKVADDHTHDIVINEELVNKILSMKPMPSEILRHNTSTCALFLPAELPILPKELQYELICEEASGRLPVVAVDSKVLLYYLLYRIHEKLGNKLKMKVWLDSLNATMERDQNLCHLDTANNLMGCIFRDMGETTEALQCFVESLKKNSKRTVAIWHILITCFDIYTKFGLD